MKLKLQLLCLNGTLCRGINPCKFLNNNYIMPKKDSKISAHDFLHSLKKARFAHYYYNSSNSSDNSDSNDKQLVKVTLE